MRLYVVTKDKNENNEDYHFRYSATLRIWGDIDNLNEISTTLKLEPTYVHKKGEQAPLKSVHKFDMWGYTVPVARAQSFALHLNTLWAAIRSHKDYLIKLKQTLQVDVFCGYQSNASAAGFEVPYTALEIFIELQIPFDVSVIVTSNELRAALSKASNG